ncbi:S10 family peptidase [Henriciella litoralis]|uniref:S10 family peptidase n=1 Tax=Henriciella litoralis TaxID=568102 RepID=UPI001F15C426|nr:septum formation initiator [Henriciella litoralis]
MLKSVSGYLKIMSCASVGIGLLAACATAQAYDIPVSEKPLAETTAPVEATADAHEPGLYRKVTQHEITVNGQRVTYDAIAAETLLSDMNGAPTGRIFSFTYLRTNDPAPDRPVLFVFNGGPGSSSLWIHMGAIGPKRVLLDAEVNPSNVPPFGVESNPDSVIDVADIVFIDPVGTGFSLAEPDVDPATFWGVDEDADSVAQFIELWLSEYGRWNAPKYVLGESYGTQRASVLPRALMGSPIYNGVMRGITLDGIILLGTTLEGRGGPEPTAHEAAEELARSLPGLAVTAFFHGQSQAGFDDVGDLFDAASEYAKGPYSQALMKLSDGTLSDDERQDVIDELETYTGLSAAEIGDDLVVDEREFAKLLLADGGQEVGMYDSRYTLPLANSGNDPVADDPAMGQYVPGFVGAFNQMLGETLGVETGRPYIAIHWKDLLPAWNWERRGVLPGQSYAVDLAWSMRRNRDLRLFVASGYYDLVTTPADAFAQIAGAGLPLDRVRFENYASGHMLYLGGTGDEFAEDLREFMTNK